jgi:hypothetical protein
MALYRCGSGGGTMTETKLWENPNPTTSFSRQTIALSDDMDNYQYLKFDFRSSSSNDESASILVPIDTVKKCTIPSSGAGQYVNVGLVCLGNGTRYCRMIGYISNSSIEFSVAYQMNGSGTPSTMSIPLKVSGMK